MAASFSCILFEAVRPCQAFVSAQSSGSATARPSITAPGERPRRVNADPMGDRRDARIWLQRLSHNLRFELVRPASAKLLRRSLKTAGDRFDHMEGSSSRTRRTEKLTSACNTAADSQSFPNPPGEVSLPLTFAPARRLRRGRRASAGDFPAVGCRVVRL